MVDELLCPEILFHNFAGDISQVSFQGTGRTGSALVLAGTVHSADSFDCVALSLVDRVVSIALA